MSKYYNGSRENRFKDLSLPEEFRNYNLGRKILIIHKHTGIPFCGEITERHSHFDVSGKLVTRYTVWIEEIGKFIKHNDIQYETSTLGYF